MKRHMRITSADQAQRLIYGMKIKEDTLIFCPEGVFQVTAINECAEKKSECWATLKECLSDELREDYLSDEDYFWTCYDFVGKEVTYE